MRQTNNWSNSPQPINEEQRQLAEIEKNLRIRQWNFDETVAEPEEILQKKGTTWQDRALAIQALVNNIDPGEPNYATIEQIERHLNPSEETEAKVRIIAVQALGKLRRLGIIPAEPLWRPLMNKDESDPGVKAAAAEQMAASGAQTINAANRQVLIQLLHSQEVAPNGRIAIMRLLEKRKDQITMHALLKTLKMDEDVLVREAAVFVLGRLLAKTPDESIINALHEALYDPDKQVRSAAIYALGSHIRLNTIIQATSDKQKQAVAAQLLGKLGDKYAIKPLLSLAQNARSPFTRIQALLALRQIGRRLPAKTLQKELPFHVLEQLTRDNSEEIALTAKIVIESLYPESRSQD